MKPKKTRLILSTIGEMKDKHPDLSFGEMLYSILNKANLPSKPDNVNTSWLLGIDDDEFYNAVEAAIIFEKQEEKE